MKKSLLLVIIVLCFNCSSNEDNEPAMQLPSLTTHAITNIISSSGISGGTILNDGGAAIIARGICWGINKKPTINNSVNRNGAGLGGFSGQMIDLDSDTEYYVRSFATNSLGTSYGNELNFRTLKDITYDILLFEFTPDTGNNTSRLKYEIKLYNPNNISVNGFYKITLSIDGFVSSSIANISSACYEMDPNSNCIISFDKETSFDLGLIKLIELVSVEYNFENK